jgi:hypothetical protein
MAGSVLIKNSCGVSHMQLNIRHKKTAKLSGAEAALKVELGGCYASTRTIATPITHVKPAALMLKLQH